MTKPLVHFAHGKDSGPWGFKITRLAEIARERGMDAESLDYSGIDSPRLRSEKLVAACKNVSRPVILVGSSMGGWVAAAASRQIPAAGLFLLAPAFYFPGYPDVTPGCPGEKIEVVHGWADDVILFEHSVRFSREHGATLHLVRDDHRLAETIDLTAECFSSFLGRVLR
ncbi:MAG TPA: alpha/beta fold hydrolase [Burkholderiales bacterium]|nr:alpha/beta fold hydrolase [Burkholderiales bacterium]